MQVVIMSVAERDRIEREVTVEGCPGPIIQLDLLQLGRI